MQINCSSNTFTQLECFLGFQESLAFPEFQLLSAGMDASSNKPSIKIESFQKRTSRFIIVKFLFSTLSKTRRLQDKNQRVKEIINGDQK